MEAIDAGMNIAEVEALGVLLRKSADDLAGFAAVLDRLVKSAAWQGAVATKFKVQWWPQHRTRLGEIEADVRGFGQSAANNAGEQRTVSEDRRVDLLDPSRPIRTRGEEHGVDWSKARLVSSDDPSSLLPTDPQWRDIKQGYIGDCFFAAAVASMATTENGRQILRQMVTLREDGTFDVKFADGQVVRVDGDLYYLNGGLAGGGGSDGEPNWFSILEKAYAQRSATGYDKLDDGGFPTNVFEGLLPVDQCRVPLTVHILQNEDFVNTPLRLAGSDFGTSASDDVWKLLRAAQAADRPTAVSVTGETLPGFVDGGHALSVIDTFDQGGTRMVTLRNPWGSNDGTLREGGLSREAVLTNAGAHLGPNGTFTMSVEDLTKITYMVYE